MTKPLVEIDAQLATMEADERLGLHDLPRLTSQQKVFVAARVSGLSIAAASQEAGCSRQTGSNWDKDPDIQRHRAHYEEEMERHSLPRVRFGVEDAHMMYIRAYHSAGTAMEMVRATDSLVKLHRLNEAPVAEVPKTVTARQLADLPVAELMRLAGMKLDSLAPGPIEGELVEVDDA
jgi:hypothetical protein